MEFLIETREKGSKSLSSLFPASPELPPRLSPPCPGAQRWGRALAALGSLHAVFILPSFHLAEQ